SAPCVSAAPSSRPRHRPATSQLPAFLPPWRGARLSWPRVSCRRRRWRRRRCCRAGSEMPVEISWIASRAGATVGPGSHFLEFSENLFLVRPKLRQFLLGVLRHVCDLGKLLRKLPGAIVDFLLLFPQELQFSHRRNAVRGDAPFRL